MSYQCHAVAESQAVHLCCATCTSAELQTSYKLGTMTVSFYRFGVFLFSFPRECLNDLQSPCASMPLCRSPEQGLVVSPNLTEKGKRQLRLAVRRGTRRRTLKVTRQWLFFLIS